MATYINTNPDFGDRGPFTAASREEIADEMHELFVQWTNEWVAEVEARDGDEVTPSERAEHITELREEFIAGLEDVTQTNRYRSGDDVYALCSRCYDDDLVPDTCGQIVCYATDYGWREASEADAAHYGALLRAHIAENREQTDEEFEANEAAAADLDIEDVA